LGRHVGGGRFSPGDVLEDLRQFLPTGAFSNAGLADFIGRVSRHTGRDDRFDDLAAPLVLTATDLDTGERAVFGAGWDATPPLSQAVRASTAIPVYFEPVRIGGRDLIDGQIIDPVHLDLSAGKDTRAVIAVSPLVPYSRERGGSVRDIGAAAIMDQSGRIAAEIKLKRSRAQFNAKNPDLPCLVVQPEPADVEELLNTRFQQESMVAAWELGFCAAARFLRGETDALSRALNPLGIQLNSGLLEQAERKWGVEPSEGD
jgi:predicted acylesterase/phospholipase RssA